MKKPTKTKGRRRAASAPAPQEAPPVATPMAQPTSIVLSGGHTPSDQYENDDAYKAARVFRVEEITNSLDYYIGQMLALTDVETLIGSSSWTVTIRAP